MFDSSAPVANTRPSGDIATELIGLKWPRTFANSVVKTLWKKRASKPPEPAAVVVTYDESCPPPHRTWKKNDWHEIQVTVSVCHHGKTLAARHRVTIVQKCTTKKSTHIE